MFKLLRSILFILLPAQFFATQFYVSPSGLPNASGSMSDPWDLQTALHHPLSVQAGDTIWLRGGVYLGNPDPAEVAAFISDLTGTKEKPIIVCQFPGERAIIDGANRPHPVSVPPANDSYILGIRGDYCWYWGFEVTNSNPHSRSDSLSGFRWRVNSIITIGTGIRLINMIIHDTGSGLGPFSGCVDCELYGNIIFYNGWSHLGVRGHGEGVYGQNMTPTKFIRDNIVFKQFDSGIILYGSSNSTIDNFHIEGNVLFSNGVINDDPNGWGFLFGKSGPSTGPGNNFLIQYNYLYNRFDYLRSNNIDLGYQSGLKDVIFRNNYSVGRWAMRNNLPIDGLTAHDNTLIGEIYPVTATQVSRDSNAIFSPTNLPRENAIFIRPNLYENNRAHIVCFNWTGATQTDIDLRLAGLNDNSAIEIYDVQNIFGNPVYRGIYTTSNPVISLPLNLKEVTPVIGENVPRAAVHTDSVMNVFLIQSAKTLVNTENSQTDEYALHYDSFSNTLQVTMNENSRWEISCFDISGKLLVKKSFSGRKTEMKLFSDLPALCFVQIVNGKQFVYKKFLTN